MSQCFDPNCRAPAPFKLRGFRMCVEHYIEALEHGAAFGGRDNLEQLFDEIEEALCQPRKHKLDSERS